MRFNRLRTLPRWLWFMKTMPTMLKELESRPDSGLLWYRNYIPLPNLIVQQYCENVDKTAAPSEPT
jgi:hypothetical protein